MLKLPEGGLLQPIPEALKILKAKPFQKYEEAQTKAMFYDPKVEVAGVDAGARITCLVQMYAASVEEILQRFREMVAHLEENNRDIWSSNLLGGFSTSPRER